MKGRESGDRMCLSLGGMIANVEKFANLKISTVKLRVKMFQFCYLLFF